MRLQCLLALALLLLPPMLRAQVRSELTADQLEMVSAGDETRAVCTGNVVFTGTNLKIVCDRLEVVAVRVGEDDVAIPALERFKSLLATGNVRIVQGEREATCGRAEVLPREDKVVLTENPVLLDRSSDYVAVGDRITLLRGEGRVLVDNPKLSGPAIEDLGPDASPSPATPAVP